MTLRHLKIFVTVCECEGVTAAAEKLYIAQPSVSLAISELEDYYGIKLFDRISRKLYLTEVGKQFLQYAQYIVSLFNDLETQIKNWDQIGVLRIGASITIGNYLLPGFVQEFKERYSQMTVTAIIDNSENIENQILCNGIDFALIEGSPHNPAIHGQDFMEDELVLICSAAHPFAMQKEIGIGDLAEQNFILREKGSAGREIFDSIMQLNGIQITPSWQSVSTQAIVRAVAKGLGISVLPYLLVKSDLEAKTVCQVKIKDVSFKRKLFIIYHKNKFLTNAMREFISICLNDAAKINSMPS